MVLRSSVTRGLRLATRRGRVAANASLPWVNHYRLAASAGLPISDRKKSTNAKKPDMANLMVSEFEDPLERFRHHFTKGTLTRPLVISCLEDAFSLNRPGSRMGEAAIMWIWRSYDSIEYPGDADLLNFIALLLVREGKEELLWDWMDQEPQKPPAEKLPSIPGKFEPLDPNYSWRTTAFRALIEAKARLATNRSLDAALEAFLRGTKVPYHLATQAAANFCHRMLCMGPQDLVRSYDDLRSGLAFPNTSPRLWNAFYEEIGKRPGSFARQNQALMELHHPQHPNPWPSFEYWLEAELDENHPYYRIKQRSAAIARIEDSRNIQLVLKHLGHQKEAEWLKDFTNKLFPHGKTPSGKSHREQQTPNDRPLPSLQSFEDPQADIPEISPAFLGHHRSE